MDTANRSKRIFIYRPTPSVSTEEGWAKVVYGPKKSHQLAAMFHCVPFQFFITISPTDPVQIPKLKAMVSRFRADAEHVWKTMHGEPCEVAFIAGYENEPNPHVHICVVSRSPLEQVFLERIWRRFVGTNPKSVDVQGLDSKGRGRAVSYCLKCADHPAGGAGEYDTSDNLKCFLPRNNSRTRSERKRRQFERSPAAMALLKRFGKKP